MIFDQHNQYSAAQAVTATARSTNVIDHGIARDFGVGESLFLVVALVVAMTDAGSDSTVVPTLETDDNAAFSSTKITATLPTFAALAAAGTLEYLRLGPDHINEQFSSILYTVANGNLSTGSFTSFLTHDIDKATAYAKNYTIS